RILTEIMAVLAAPKSCDGPEGAHNCQFVQVTFGSYARIPKCELSNVYGAMRMVRDWIATAVALHHHRLQRYRLHLHQRFHLHHDLRSLALETVLVGLLASIAFAEHRSPE